MSQPTDRDLGEFAEVVLSETPGAGVDGADDGLVPDPAAGDGIRVPRSVLAWRERQRQREHHARDAALPDSVTGEPWVDGPPHSFPHPADADVPWCACQSGGER